MPPYEPLAKLFYKDSSASRFERNKQLARRRLEADATFKTGINTPAGELFLAVPHELSLINERVLRQERLVSAALRRLPSVARTSLVMSLVADEVVWTNELENIHSTRRQIGTLLVESREKHHSTQGDIETKRFRELARLYLELSDEHPVEPQTPEAIRAIYDRIMQGEPMDGKEPDGKLFRQDPVDVIGRGGRIVHSGVSPEGAIIDTLRAMIDLTSSGRIPDMYAAVIAHYVFEYVHPFYDGNGRTGRYLLALHLSNPLSVITSLSLSRAIAERKDAYYRSFKVVQDPLNHGELTFFVLSMLETIAEAQASSLSNLVHKEGQLNQVNLAIGALGADLHLSDKEIAILRLCAQVQLFAPLPNVTLLDVASHLGLGEKMARTHIKRLEESGLVRPVARRPLRFALTPTACDSLGLDNPSEDG